MKRRTFSLIALLSLLLGMIAIADPAQATTNSISDPTSDNSPTFDGRGDVTFNGITYQNGLVMLGLGVRTPVSPDAWTSGQAGMLWYLDVNGDSNEDFKVFVGKTSFGTYAEVDDPALNTLCNAELTYNGTLYFVSFPASCIGHPTAIQQNVFMTFSTSSGTSMDGAPDNFSAFCCHVTETITSTTTTTTTTTASPPVDPPVTSAGVHDGYWMLTESGQVFGFGSANSTTLTNSQPFVHIAPTPSGKGYWGLTEGGNIVPKGDASALPSIGVFPGERAVSLSSTPSGLGLFVFTDKGRVVTLGDAQSFGDMSKTQLNGAILGSVATPTGKGYWMVGSDGGIFSFGDAVFHGSMGNVKLNKPAMAMAPASDSSGYWLVASDGGIFAFDVPFYGSMGGTPLNKPVSGMVPGNAGYMMVAEDGGIFSFGNVAFHGSLGANPPSSPVVSVALQP